MKFSFANKFAVSPFAAMISATSPRDTIPAPILMKDWRLNPVSLAPKPDPINFVENRNESHNNNEPKLTSNALKCNFHSDTYEEYWNKYCISNRFNFMFHFMLILCLRNSNSCCECSNNACNSIISL